jgi:hypothetical protein
MSERNLLALAPTVLDGTVTRSILRGLQDRLTWASLFWAVLFASSLAPSWAASSPFDRTLSLSPGRELHIRQAEPFRFSLALGHREVSPPEGLDWPEQGRVMGSSFKLLRINARNYALVTLRLEHGAAVFSMANLACLIALDSARCPLAFTAWAGQDAGYEEAFECRSLIVIPGRNREGDELLVPSLVVPERHPLIPPAEIARLGFAQPLKAGFARYRMEPGGRFLPLASRELVLLDEDGHPGDLGPATVWNPILATAAHAAKGDNRSHVRDVLLGYLGDLQEDPNWSARDKRKLRAVLSFLLGHLNQKDPSSP